MPGDEPQPETRVDNDFTRCPGCLEPGTPFAPAESPGDSARDATSKWTLPDTSGISEDDFPVDCDTCGRGLAGLGDVGRCPACGAGFDRRERLVHLYGPEVFMPKVAAQDAAPKKPAANTGDVVVAVLITALAFIGALAYPRLVAEGVVESDRWPFVALMFVAALGLWLRAFHKSTD